MIDGVVGAARELCLVAAEGDWAGPDIYDGLAARWPRPLTSGPRRRQAIIQLHARAPIDLRPLSRREHRPIAKAAALFAQADLRLAGLGDARRHRASATRALDVVHADQRAGSEAWGYPWDVQTRWGHYLAGSPNVIVTAFAVQALVEGGRALDRPDYRERALAAARWVQERLFRPSGGFYAYHAGSQAVIHNANLLGARAASLAGDGDAVMRAVDRTLSAQAPDGSFPYGEGAGLAFVDSFHTGYVIECLCDLAATTAADSLGRAADFYCASFFDSSGRATLWPSRRYPEDAHSAGTGLTTLARLQREGLGDPGLLQRVAGRAAHAMVRKGHAIHRRYRWGSTRVRYVRWADAHMALGLANAALALGHGDGRSGSRQARRVD